MGALWVGVDRIDLSTVFKFFIADCGFSIFPVAQPSKRIRCEFSPFVAFLIIRLGVFLQTILQNAPGNATS